MSEALHLCQAIARPAQDVYDYARDPANLPAWAAGLGGAVRCVDGRWLVSSPVGELEVAFVPENPYGVLDHDVVLPDGTTVTNPMRVLPDGDGCEVVFTLRRQPGTTDEELARDAAAVTADLARLRDLLEA